MRKSLILLDNRISDVQIGAYWLMGTFSQSKV